MATGYGKSLVYQILPFCAGFIVESQAERVARLLFPACLRVLVILIGLWSQDMPPVCVVCRKLSTSCPGATQEPYRLVLKVFGFYRDDLDTVVITSSL